MKLQEIQDKIKTLKLSVRPKNKAEIQTLIQAYRDVVKEVNFWASIEKDGISIKHVRSDVVILQSIIESLILPPVKHSNTATIDKTPKKVAPTISPLS